MSLVPGADAHFDQLKTTTAHHVVIVRGAAEGVAALFDKMKTTFGQGMADPKMHGEGPNTQLVFGLSAAHLCSGEKPRTAQQAVGEALKAHQVTADVSGGVIHPAQRVAAEHHAASRRNWLIVSLAA